MAQRLVSRLLWLLVIKNITSNYQGINYKASKVLEWDPKVYFASTLSAAVVHAAQRARGQRHHNQISCSRKFLLSQAATFLSKNDWTDHWTAWIRHKLPTRQSPIYSKKSCWLFISQFLIIETTPINKSAKFSQTRPFPSDHLTQAALDPECAVR